MPRARPTAAVPLPATLALALSLALAAALLGACGSAENSTAAASPAPAEPSATIAAYTVSGTMVVAETAAVDSDTNDPNQPARKDNGAFDTSQPLPNPVQLTGYLTMPGEGPDGPGSATGDLVDSYRLFLEEGQVVELEFSADPSRFDIDLFVHDADGVLRGRSTGSNRYECIRVTSAGHYFVGVQISPDTSSGGSVYQLRIGAPGSGSACANATGAADLLIADEIVAQASETTRRRLAGDPQSLADVVVLKGNVAEPRPVLLRMPAGHRPRELALERMRVAAKSAVPGASGPQAPASRSREAAGAQIEAWRRSMPERTRALHQTIDDAKLLVASGEYAHAVPNFEVQAAQTVALQRFPPNDREYVKQRWHYEAINLPGAMAALEGLDLSASDPPIVAVVDTGIVGSHPDLSNQLVAGYDFVSTAASAGDGGGSDADPDDASLKMDFPFHGTHVAGTIAAQTYNGIGGAGIAPIARIMPVRVLGTSGSGTLYDILQGVRFAAGMDTDAGVVPVRRADIINLSLESQGMPCDPLPQQLFSEVRARGVIAVAAAGNASRPDRPMPVGFPANCADVFPVAATDALNRRASYSNEGPEILIAAPGGDMSQSTTGSGLPDGIFSATASVDGTGNRLPAYGYLQGTSMAVPHVAGVLALMRWANPSLTAQAIEALVRDGSIVDDIGPQGRDDSFGYGLINARKAVDAALAARSRTAPQPPSVAGETKAQPGSISLGSIRSEAEMVLSHVGVSSERVLSVASDSPVITVTPKAGAVDPGTGLGSYLVRPNRQLMTAGSSLFPRIVVQLSSGRTLSVQVALERRQADAGLGNLGPIYLLVLDAASQTRKAAAETIVIAPVAGRYRYSVTVPGTTAISIVAGSDLGNTGGICSAGEACGAFPMLNGKLEVLHPRGDLEGIDFTLFPAAGISPDATGAQR